MHKDGSSAAALLLPVKHTLAIRNHNITLKGGRLMTDIVFVSMPFGDKSESSENKWTKLSNHGLKPLEGKIDGLP